MIDPDAFAALLCDWSIRVREGDQVLLRSTPLATRLVRALHAAVLERGAWPLVRMAPTELTADLYRHARELQLDAFAPLDLREVQDADAQIRIDAPADTSALASIDPALLARVRRARASIQEATQALRWCTTQWPTAALAEDAGMSERDYDEFLEHALFLDRPDPAAAWQELAVRQQRIVQLLAGADEVRIEAEGTDLRLRVTGRTWINSDGRHNMPSGEVFTGPLEDSASGTVRFTVPSNVRGVIVRDAQLTFAAGEVTAARAASGDDFLQAALATDPGARRLGELGIGTNTGIDRPTGTTLLDEKIAGTVHLALGRSYPETGGRNRSALHWDLICDLRGGGRLTVDGEALELAA